MLVYAHRGLHDHAPENTMAAFLRAEMSGVDGIETDLRTTADGRVVLFHDRTVRGRAVVEHTHAELVAATGIAVPTLEEVLDREWRVRWNFEIKTRAAGELAAPALRDRAPAGSMVSSFDHVAARDAARATGLEGGLLVASLGTEDVRLPEPDGAVRTLIWDWNVVRPDAITSSRWLEWKTMVYGPVTAGEHEALAVLRPWGVITDHPALVPAHLRSDGDER
jgi:glycerophosphoryl diester phosphodiesterase